MRVVKRNGTTQEVLFDKVTSRIRKLSDGLTVSPDVIAQKVLSSIHDGISTTEIDNTSAEIAISMMTENIDYETLASRILVSNLQKNCPKTFSEAMSQINCPSEGGSLDKYIVHERDFDFDFFGLKTLLKMYLSRNDQGKIVETPQYMFMRVAIQVSDSHINSILETYEALSTKMYIHATPTLFNSGMVNPQCSSCFLVAMKDDSVNGIYDTKKEMALISKYAGGIGLHIHNVRAKGSKIYGNNGVSDGIIPMLRTINADARYINQGGRRKGSVAVYLEPWHADIMDFLEIRLNQGDEESRCRDLFTALWIPDLFMKRLELNQDWSLFCPNEAKGLADVHGDEFEALYTRYEQEGRARMVVPIQKIWKMILKSQVETGTPYILYKDSCNSKSNQKNVGTIKSSNLCVEIIEHSDKDSTAVCNLASLALPSYVKNGVFDYKRLDEITRLAVKNLNNVIDRNFYPVEEARRSNLRLRPIAIGVQGLADTFALMNLPFDSEKAAAVNKEIFSCIYHAALEASAFLAMNNVPYDGYEKSPAAQGIFQPEMWGLKTNSYTKEIVARYGLRNSLLVALMPTASTSQILGFNECFEPFTTNIYLRRTLAGEFVVVNKYLVRDLTKLGLWNKRIKNEIIRDNGSIQRIDEIPVDIKMLYKTVWEISPKVIINQARDRSPYVCQSQSMNLFVEEPTNSKLSSIHMYTWKQGLKTGMYYLRTRPKAKAIQVTLDPECVMCAS
jgi:ribonucleoside-diphosphate reductase alpha subunit